MCDQCPEIKERFTEQYGVTVVAMIHDTSEHALVYNIALGDAMVMVTLPVTSLASGATECALFIGEHLPEILSATSHAFMSRQADLMAAKAVEDLEAMLRDAPDS